MTSQVEAHKLQEDLAHAKAIAASARITIEHYPRRDAELGAEINALSDKRARLLRDAERMPEILARAEREIARIESIVARDLADIGASAHQEIHPADKVRILNSAIREKQKERDALIADLRASGIENPEDIIPT